MVKDKSNNKSMYNSTNKPPAIFFIFLFIISFTSITKAQRKIEPLLGNYNSQQRINNHVNSLLLLKGLKDMKANTYMWLIGGGNDWEDFKDFLPLAQKAGISVWAYLRPPTETPATGYDGPYSEPYKSDYIGWAKAIAKLSLKYSNLVGYVIDDFWYNTPAYERGTLFAASYIRKMVTAGKSVNPDLNFYPLLYFRQIDISFIDSLSTLIDGVVAAYPGQVRDRFNISDSLAIIKALGFTNDDYQIIRVSLPGSTISSKGDYGFASKNITVTNPSEAKICISHYSDRSVNVGLYPVGYHKIQIRIDGKIAWSQDVVDINGVSVVNLSEALKGKNNCRLSIGLYNNSGVSNYYVHTKLQVIGARGIKFNSPNWDIKKNGKYNISIVGGNNSNHLPLIVMPAGNIPQYSKRYPGPATAQNIAKRVSTIISLLKAGKIAGVVTFALDMYDRTKIFEEVSRIYQSYWKSQK